MLISSGINETKITKGCEDGWTPYRNSCFKKSSTAFENPQSLNQSTIETSCNQNKSKMAILYSSDIKNLILVI